jgi:lipoic acid synthetase
LSKPAWLRSRFVSDENTEYTRAILDALGLNTVCREAMCPNWSDCFSRRTATFMILGVNCTRDCAFCNVTHGAPTAPDPNEPARIGEAVAQLGLSYVVVTSVTRDDLPDGGARPFAETVRAIRQSAPEAAIETLIPDFGGDVDALKIVLEAKPDVVSHNVETVKALYAEVRPDAVYERSLALIENIGRLSGTAAIHSKTGFMVGLGETEPQVLRLMDDLRAVDCAFLTIGQYLAPSRAHHPVVEYIHPDTFERYAEIARAKGFAFVASAPFVRSSYHAGEALGIGPEQ